MRTTMTVSVSLLATILSCTRPAAGDSCSRAGVLDCVSSSAALECRAGTVRTVPCRGDGGCAQHSATIECDTSGNLHTEPCLASDEGKAHCDWLGGFWLLRCIDGTWERNSCNGRICEVIDGGFNCN